MIAEAFIPGLPLSLGQQLPGLLKGYPAVVKAVLFGSRAKGNYRPNSDVDICLVAPGMGFSQFLQLTEALGEFMFPYSLDLVLQHQIDNPDLLDHIHRVGIVIYQS